MAFLQLNAYTLKSCGTYIRRPVRLHKTKILLPVACLVFLYPQKIAENPEMFSFVKDDCLVAALGTTGNSYFLKNGQVTGYHFDLITEYCKAINRKPVFIVEEDAGKRLNLLFSDAADIAVCNMKADSILQIKNINHVRADNAFLHTHWLVSGRNNGLARSMTAWLNSYIETKDYKLLASKYNAARKPYKSRTYISEYDDLIKKYSSKINWDWRLIASLVCQESKFIPDVKSRKDASGLMQIRKQTAEFLGFDSIDSNEKNIAAGIRLIKFLENYFAKDSTIDAAERTKFVLAAYNAGHGKIDIFRKNTERKGFNSSIWANVENTNTKQKHGKNQTFSQKHFLSKETVLFVSEILDRYEHYKNFFEE
ncbi:MAG: transglycosylase SLT domain-containing protein [Prevotellaceae bacterium]|jgi:membrane-bound lytic murein transglycosylase F|nr:transglycosylase SLT domain-containing protein [Prevotellaceae bacterium]